MSSPLSVPGGVLGVPALGQPLWRGPGQRGPSSSYSCCSPHRASSLPPTKLAIGGQGGAETQAGGQAPGTLTTGACFLLRPRQGVPGRPGHLAGRAPRAWKGRVGALRGRPSAGAWVLRAWESRAGAGRHMERAVCRATQVPFPELPGPLPEEVWQWVAWPSGGVTAHLQGLTAAGLHPLSAVTWEPWLPWNKRGRDVPSL